MISTVVLCLVVAVADGDTLTVRCGDPGAYQQLKVRIQAMDAPERNQPFGQRSRRALAQLCFGQNASIWPRAKDRYGRTLGQVACQGKDVASEQIRAGMGWYYVQYGHGFEHLAQLEQEAREGTRGLWSAQAVPPWEWRKSERQSASR